MAQVKSGFMLAAAVCGALLAASPASAKHGSAKDQGQHLDRLSKKLELTDEQRGQVGQVLDDYHTRSQALSDQLKALRKEKHERIRALLSPEQQERFDRMQQKMGKRHQGWWRRHRGGAKSDRD